MDLISHSLVYESNKRKSVQIRSTEMINKINSTENKIQQKIAGEKISYGKSPQFQCQFNVPDEPKPMFPIKFSKLSLISDLMIRSRSEFSTSIEEKKQKYKESLKEKQIYRQNFIRKMNESLKRQVLKQSQAQCQQMKSPQFQDQEEQHVSFTLSGQKQTEVHTHRDMKKNKIQTKNQFQHQKISSGYSQKVAQTDKKQSKKKVVLKRKQSLKPQKDCHSQTSTYNQIKNSLIIGESLKTISDDTMLKSKNQFLFLQQYQKDQKQIMNRLLTIIQHQLIKKSQTTNKTNHTLQDSNQQSNKNLSHSYIRGYEDQPKMVKSIKVKNSSNQHSFMMDQSLLQRQNAIKKLQQNRKNKKYKEDIKNDQKLNIKTIKFSKKKSFTSNQKPSPLKIQHLDQSQLDQRQNQICQSSHKLQRIKQKQTQKFIQENEDELSLKKNSSQETINFQQLYLKLKQQTKKQKHKKSIITQINQNSPQFSSINPSHQTSINKTFNQTSFKVHKEQQVNNPIFSQSSLKNTQKLRNTLISSSQNNTLSQFNANISVINQEKKEIKEKIRPSVSLQIPLGEQNSMNKNLSLADAFKKKFGANRFERKNKENTQNQKSKEQKTHSLCQLSQLKSTQNTMNKVKNTQFNSLGSNDKFEITLTKPYKQRNKEINERNKQNFNSMQTPRNHSMNRPQSQRSMKTNQSKEPPKQLIDRLIYGKKASMSKKDMYELSKKNYMKLPEIQQKRKQQQKRQKQIQRLQKIKQYQKKIRSSKKSTTKDDIKIPSIDIDIN